jgi:hypothetical protein
LILRRQLVHPLEVGLLESDRQPCLGGRFSSSGRMSRERIAASLEGSMRDSTAMGCAPGWVKEAVRFTILVQLPGTGNGGAGSIGLSTRPRGGISISTAGQEIVLIVCWIWEARPLGDL